MKTINYELRTRTSEVRVARSIDMIRPGCAADFAGADQDSELVKTFDTVDAAKAALAKHESYVKFFQAAGMQFASVEEYWIEVNTYEIDEDGDAEWIEGGDIVDYSEMPNEIEWRSNTYRWDATANQYEISESANWYAVMTDLEDDDWGTGSHDLDEAIAMVRRYREDGKPDAYIAVIDESGVAPFCIDEIHEIEED